MYALNIAADHYNIYWETGVCSAVPERPSEVIHPNPTLAYSMASDKFVVHYGTDSLACFHLAEALAPAVGSAPEEFTLKDVVDVCKTQFSRWCTSVCKVNVHVLRARSSYVALWVTPSACTQRNRKNTTKPHSKRHFALSVYPATREVRWE
ncbi:hypothetical protein DFH29DRAFT_910542 [Suillus ampliporus]|nr:hypothetical protein DFH29DRAFT_910542 [Suillus ampliporus]